jgi:NAD(P)-dependent dehydrogenase (short-subunit alcohol dehydrogenase family)
VTTPRRYKDRVSLITGASSGLGEATVWRLTEEGARAHLIDINADQLEVTAAALSEEGREVTTSVCDVSDPKQVRAAIDECLDAHGALHSVANNAGVYIGNPFNQVSAEEWDSVMTVNLEGTFLVSQAAAKRMTATDGGCAITNVASVYGQIGDTFDPMASYAASKAGVASLTRQLAVEYGPLGIRVNAICPGMIETPMNDEWKEDPRAWNAFIEQKVPANRAATATEVAALHAFLGCDEASYVTAALVYIDGGWSAI